MAYTISTNSDDAIELVNNAYLDGVTWKYKENGFASRIRILSQFTEFLHAVSGLADATITWIQDLSVENDGRIYMGAGIGLTNNGRLLMQINDSEDGAQVGGMVYNTLTATGNVTTGEDPLASAPILAGTLQANQSLRYEAYGTIANNANAKILRVRFGSTTIASRTMTPNTSVNWLIKGTLHGQVGSSQKGYTLFVENSVTEVDAGTSTENQNADLTLDITGEGVATNDIILQAFKVWWDDNKS